MHVEFLSTSSVHHRAVLSNFTHLLKVLGEYDGCIPHCRAQVLAAGVLRKPNSGPVLACMHTITIHYVHTKYAYITFSSLTLRLPALRSMYRVCSSSPKNR